MSDVSLRHLQYLHHVHNVTYRFKRRAGDVFFDVYDAETGEKLDPAPGLRPGLEVSRK